MSSSLFSETALSAEEQPALPERFLVSDVASNVEKEESPGSEEIQVYSTEKNKKYRKRISALLRALCAIGLLIYLFMRTSWHEILQNIRHVDDGELLIGCIVGMAGVVISSYQWQSLLASERMHFDLRKLINYYFIGITFNHFLPTGMGGDVIKAYYTGKAASNPIGATSAVVISRIAGFIGMLLVAFTALIVWHSIFPRSFIVSFILAGLAMGSALIFVFCASGLLPRYIKGPRAEHLVLRSMLRISNALHQGMRQPRSMLVAVGYGILFHVSAALNYYSFALMLNIHIPFTFFLVAIPFISLVAVLPVSLNGYGLRETAFVNVFSMMHVHPSTALALALLVDVQMLFFALAGGVIYLSINKQRRKIHIIHHSYQETENIPSQDIPLQSFPSQGIPSQDSYKSTV